MDISLENEFSDCALRGPSLPVVDGVGAVQAGAALRPGVCRRSCTSDKPTAQLDRARTSLPAGAKRTRILAARV